MYEHICKTCGHIWHDHEYDAVCPNCWSGEYTTEWTDPDIITVYID